MTEDSTRRDEKDEQEERPVIPQDGREGPVDPYTGEVEPPAPDAYKVTEIVPTDPDNREGENFLMDEEDSLDKFVLDADTDEVLAQIVLTLLALALFGGQSILHFVLTLMIGILSGTYSSIFHAAQILVVWEYKEWRTWFRRKPKSAQAAT